jgi:hypothetical protein
LSLNSIVGDATRDLEERFPPVFGHLPWKKLKTCPLFALPQRIYKKIPSRFLFVPSRYFLSLPQQKQQKRQIFQRRQMLKRIDHFRPLPFLSIFDVGG